MRLNPFDVGKINVGTTGGGLGGKSLGCGGIIVVLIGVFVFGADPAQMIGQMGGSGGGQEVTASDDEQAICSSNQYANETCSALTSLNETWENVFDEQGYGDQFRQPRLEFATAQQFRTGCGTGNVGMGPFYCPADETIYIDVGFYDQLARMSGNGGDFARLYVVAHEYAHHLQTVMGLSGQIRSAQQANPSRANQLSVLLELHADCYAGVWAGRNRNLIESGDFEEGMQAAAAIGDDRLTGGRVSQESFTHGTSQQRMEALELGIRTGDDIACDNRYFSPN
ncbi:KPN_02809 family neutral zinc metallopeptidase [Aurantiacibacter sediminis]|uniref:Neutral zinc metallopeptidase n=1 Tax=Aurantiacibacter sediminis TaxID=2793064 RepID=A0ABS0N385_9SPHN|nr:neutral zinc metallopeptidase [Aurantiacibacter sediminis]MBH5322412.1 neutral zinc metallopeptidase [Aurantiacibacter sediminis]